jgi:hypothetical protein
VRNLDWSREPRLAVPLRHRYDWTGVSLRVAAARFASLALGRGREEGAAPAPRPSNVRQEHLTGRVLHWVDCANRLVQCTPPSSIPRISDFSQSDCLGHTIRRVPCSGVTAPLALGSPQPTQRVLQ